MKTKRCCACFARKPAKALSRYEHEMAWVCRNIRACDARIARADVALYRNVLGHAPVLNARYVRFALEQRRFAGRYS